MTERRRKGAIVGVRMTPDQIERNETQVTWLQAAVDAQQRRRQMPRLDLASLDLKCPATDWSAA